MTQINLTRPLRTGVAAGEMLPWERPYTTEPIATLEHNGANLFHIDMSPAASTRILGARIADPAAPSTRDIDARTILNRPTTVVDIAADADSVITASQLDAAVQAAEPNRGDALLLVTGWGEHDRLDTFDESALFSAPYLDFEAIGRLRELVRELETDLVLIDVPYIQGVRAPIIGEEWLSLVPWLRPSWPSSSAKAYLRHYSRQKLEQDWEPTLGLISDTWLVVGLRNCGRLAGTRTTVNVAPFQVEDVGEAPCTVVASVPDN